jgi:hypothetical protein
MTDTNKMDTDELVAHSLEESQQSRYKKAENRVEFWTMEENRIFELIKAHRQRSKTYKGEDK